MNFPEEIKKIRQRSFLTQQDFAKKIGIIIIKKQRNQAKKE